MFVIRERRGQACLAYGAGLEVILAYGRLIWHTGGVVLAYGKGWFGVREGNRTTHCKRTGIAAMKYRFGVRDEIAVRQGEVIVVNNGESERAGGDLHLQGGALPGLSDLSQVPELCQCQTNVLREQRLWSCTLQGREVTSCTRSATGSHQEARRNLKKHPGVQVQTS